jgi:hypothetical protein
VCAGVCLRTVSPVAASSRAPRIPPGSLSETRVRSAQLLAGVRAPSLAAQPFAAQQAGSGELSAGAVLPELVDRRTVEHFRSIAVAEQGARARLYSGRPGGPAGARRLRQLLKSIRCEPGLAAAAGGFDQFDQRPCTEPQFMRVLASLQGRGDRLIVLSLSGCISPPFVRLAPDTFGDASPAWSYRTGFRAAPPGPDPAG